MVKEILVEEYINDGIALIDQLDTCGIKVQAALWFYFDDSDEWRLIIATSMVESKGTTLTYKKIFEIIKNNKMILNFPLRKITVRSPKDPLIKLLKHAISTGGTISKIRFQNNVINNNLIEDALIYKM